MEAAAPKTPVLFVGHGSPMNGIETNAYSLAWEELGKQVARPKAVLCISAHWLTAGTFVHVSDAPKTIHDFWGFPKTLYEARYPCPGAPTVAKEIQSLITKTTVSPDTEWGLDHGAWTVLHHLFPAADVPVFQMSIDHTKPSEFHYQIGKELAALREQRVLIVGSGNIVHNLRVMRYDRDAKPYDWAIEFDELTRQLIVAGDHRSLIAYEKCGRAASLAVPTPDHYWPLLYTIALQDAGEPVSFPIEGIANGSISMRTIIIGGHDTSAHAPV
ncbi:MAG TPA: 4,5-DOPA dioxygenase extradiol [Methylomirabilota bacterium]|nr:4,5-DOPA dioxygenase extradiol [Methylomirabilota bacterium]